MNDTPISRRRFLASSTALALSALPRRVPGQPESPSRLLSWHEAAPGVWLGASPDPSANLGGNTTLILAPGGATLIDTRYPAVGPALRRDAASFGPLARVINTHHHADHTGGNHAFTVDFPVLAHPNARPRILSQLRRYTDSIPGHAAALARLPGDAAQAAAADAGALLDRADLAPEAFAPTGALGGGAEIDLSGIAARTLHGGSAHTDNDLAIFLPGPNALVTGDLLFHQFHPFLDRASGGSSAGWIAALAALAELCDENTVVIPGHGAVAGRSALVEQSEYLRALRAMAAQALADGRPREEAIKSPPPEPYADYGLRQLFSVTLGAVYDELAQEQAAAPGPRP